MNDKPALTATLELVTPDMAREFLKRNLINRTVRRRWVEHLARQIKDKEWVATGDCVAVRADGMIINGQHRLLAIVMANRPALLVVAYNVPEGAFRVTDRGHGRSYSDVLEKPAALVADGNMLAHFLQDAAHPGSTRVSEKYIGDVTDWWRPTYDALSIGSDGKFAKGFSAAAVRVGFGARWAAEPEEPGRDYILEQYKALMTNDAPNMSVAGATLWKRILKEKWGGGTYERRIMGACNVYYAINPRLRDRAPLVRDLAVVRDELASVIKALPAAHEEWVARWRQGHPYHIKIARPPVQPVTPTLTWNGPDAPLW